MVHLLREYINSLFIGEEPFIIVIKTVISLFVLWITTLLLTDFKNIKASLLKGIFSVAKVIPAVDKEIKKKKGEAMTHLRKSFQLEGTVKRLSLPDRGVPYDEVLREMENLKKFDEAKYKEGKVSGCIYLGDEKHSKFLSAAYSMFSLSNPLHPDVFPSVKKFEAEVIRMTATLMHGDENSCGAMTSGGTESILMAIKAYREYYKSKTSRPELIVPCTAHAAFDKGCYYFGVQIVHIPLDSDMKVDVNKLRKAINRNTIAIVGSAPAFPHGMIDPIPELSKIAQEHNIGLHVDTCLGGFVLPFAQQLGYDIPDFDFRLPGVTSMSADVHKYGYTPKGTSVILFRSQELRSYMYFVAEDWPGGIYASPTMAGSRPGGLSAGAWASLVAIGKEGYLNYVDGIIKTTQEIVNGIKSIPDLFVIGNPKAMVVAVASKSLDIYKVNAGMSQRGWNLNALQLPSSLHICVTAKHIGKAPVFLKDLRESVAAVQADPDQFKGSTAAMYGMAATIPDRSIVRDLASSVLDVMLET